MSIPNATRLHASIRYAPPNPRAGGRCSGLPATACRADAEKAETEQAERRGFRNVRRVEVQLRQLERVRIVLVRAGVIKVGGDDDDVAVVALGIETDRGAGRRRLDLDLVQVGRDVRERRLDIEELVPPRADGADQDRRVIVLGPVAAAVHVEGVEDDRRRRHELVELQDDIVLGAGIVRRVAALRAARIVAGAIAVAAAADRTRRRDAKAAIVKAEERLVVIAAVPAAALDGPCRGADVDDGAVGRGGGELADIAVGAVHPAVDRAAAVEVEAADGARGRRRGSEHRARQDQRAHQGLRTKKRLGHENPLLQTHCAQRICSVPSNLCTRSKKRLNSRRLRIVALAYVKSADSRRTAVRRSALRGGSYLVDAKVREHVGAFVLRMAVVRLHPLPVDRVRRRRRQKRLPQIGVLHGFLVGGAPAVPLPAVHPLGDAVPQVDRIGRQRHRARLRQCLQRLDRGGQLHAVVGGQRLAAPKLAFLPFGTQQRAPSAGAGIALAGAVGRHLDVRQRLHGASR